MTISNEDTDNIYTGDGGTVAFAFNFGVFSTSEVVVKLITTATGVPVTQTITTHYTVSATNNNYWTGPGGTVTMVTAPALTEKLYIHRVPPLTQDFDLDAKSTMQTVSTKTFENVLDKIVTQIQYVNYKTGLSLKIPANESGLAVEIPNAVDRAAKFLSFDASGNPTAAAGTGDATPHTAIGVALATASAGSGARSAINAAPIYDNRDYANIAAAITAIGATEGELHIWDSETLTANASFPATLAVVVHKGGMITKASTYTVSFAGPLIAGDYQIFSGFASGNVTFAQGAMPNKVQAAWWGITRDGTGDNTVAMNSAIAAAIQVHPVYGWGQGGTVQLPEGQIRVNGSITATSAYGLIIRGVGIQATEIRGYMATATDSVMVLRDIGWGTVEDMVIKAFATCKALIRTENGAGVTNTMTSCLFRKLWLQGGVTFADYAIYFAQGAGGDANNEFHRVVDCIIMQVVEACVRIGHSQAKNITFHRSQFLYSPIGVLALADAGNQFFSFNTLHCASAVISDCVYVIEFPAEPVTIIGHNDESSGMFWRDNAGVYAGGSFTIESCRFDSIHVDPADSIIIKSGCNGGVKIVDNTFTTGDVTNVGPVLSLGGPGNNQSMIVRGNQFYGEHATSGTVPLIVLNNWTAVNGNLDISSNLYGDSDGLIVDNRTFVDSDTTPSIFDGTLFETNTTAVTITTFDNSHHGKQFSVISRGTVTYDMTTGTPTLLGSPVNVVTTAGDTTHWLTEGLTTTAPRHHLVSVTRASDTGYVEQRQSIVNLSTANIVALAATPIELVPAQGAGTLIEVIGLLFVLDYSGGALAEASAPDDLAVEYDNGTGHQIKTFDTTGFITATEDAYVTQQNNTMQGLASPITTAANVNKNVVLINTGDNYTIGASTSTMRVITTYMVHRSLGL